MTLKSIFETMKNELVALIHSEFGSVQSEYDRIIAEIRADVDSLKQQVADLQKGNN